LIVASRYSASKTDTTGMRAGHLSQGVTGFFLVLHQANPDSERGQGNSALQQKPKTK